MTRQQAPELSPSRVRGDVTVTAIAIRIVITGWHLAGIRQQLRESTNA